MEGDEIEGSRTVRLPLLFWPFYLVGGVWLGLLAWGAFRSGSTQGLKASAVVVGFVLIAPVVWSVADWLRQAAMPDMFFSRGFLDTLSKRLFWAVGPQTIGVSLAVVASTWLIIKITPEITAKRQASSPGALATEENAQTDRSTQRLDSEDTSRTTLPSMNCSSSTVFREVNRIVLDDIIAVAVVTQGQGHGIDRSQLERGVEVKLSEIEQTGGGSGENGSSFGCKANLSVHVTDDNLAAKGVTSYVQGTTFTVETLSDGTLDIYYKDD